MNLPFLGRRGVVLPIRSPSVGNTNQLGQGGFPPQGLPFRTGPVHTSDLDSFRSAVLMNSITPARRLASIDHVAFVEDHAWMEALRHCYDGNDPHAI